MHACPHCGTRTISLSQKARSSLLRPAICKNCEGQSYVAGWWHLIGALGAELWIPISIFAFLFHGKVGFALSCAVFFIFLAVISFVPKLIPLHLPSVESYTWPLSRVLLLNTAVTLLLLGLLVWATLGRA